jgi:hypothetical protein
MTLMISMIMKMKEMMMMKKEKEDDNDDDDLSPVSVKNEEANYTC